MVGGSVLLLLLLLRLWIGRYLWDTQQQKKRQQITEL